MIRVSDTLYNVLSSRTGAYDTFMKVTTKPDGNPYTDADCDGYLIKKEGTEYFKRHLLKGIDIREFKQVGDASDSEMFQRSYDLTASLSDGTTTYTLLVPEGAYNIGTQIAWNAANADVYVVGAGMRKTTLIAVDAIDGIIRLGVDDESFRGRSYISGFTFMGNDLATCLLDMRGARYTTIERNEFHSPPDGCEMLRTNDWLNRILNNVFSADQTKLNTIATRIFGGQVNHLVYFLNSISQAGIGVQVDGFNTLVNIINNSFDTCTRTGIYIQGGCRHINIKDNYFEACGKIGTDITLEDDVTVENWKAAIVAHRNFPSTTNPLNGLFIRNNHFANCTDEFNTIIALSDTVNVEIEGNTTYEQYKHDSFVDVKYNGSFYTQTRRFLVDHSPAYNPDVYDNQFNQLVKYSGDPVQITTLFNNAVIINRRTSPQLLDYDAPVINDPIKWPDTVALKYSEDTPLEGFHRVYKIDPGGISGGKQLIIPIAANSPIRNNYYRINYFTKGDVGAANGVACRIYIDGVQQRVFSTLVEDWANQGKNNLIYIPSTATELKITITTADNTKPAYLSKFSFVPAWLPLEYDSSLRYSDPIADDIEFTAVAGQTRYPVSGDNNNLVGKKVHIYVDGLIQSSSQVTKNQTDGFVTWTNPFSGPQKVKITIR